MIVVQIGDELFAKQLLLIKRVNEAKTLADHREAEAYLRGWRDAHRDQGVEVRLLDCDRHYMDQGETRPMCCGVFLDWKETDHAE